MKYLRTKLDDKLQLDLFYDAHRRASRGKVHYKEILRFNLNETGNLLRLIDVIDKGTYRPSDYFKFTVYEPKERQIMALPYPDRIVHQWAVNEFYLPYYVPRFINDTFACIEGRGPHAAVGRTQKFLRRMTNQHGDNFYILKMDISQFFYSIDQDILFNILRRAIVDPKLLELTKIFVYNYSEPVGIPIGNYTSQLFANIYLNELDQYCKNELRLKYYVRYMDDFVIMVPDKETAKQVFAAIDKFVNEHLHLQLNPKSKYYPAKLGVNFAGYRIYYDYKLIRHRSKHKLNIILRRYHHGKDDEEHFVRRVNAWYGHAKHADSYRYVQAKLGDYRDILPAIFPRQSEAEAAKKSDATKKQG